MFISAGISTVSVARLLVQNLGESLTGRPLALILPGEDTSLSSSFRTGLSGLRLRPGTLLWHHAAT